ncbi:TatD family hydrolase [Vibrio sp. 10N.261.55.A7]|uniref:TatD family hydrolase n=1 Tax=Vibrio sp. 10N.261.55.A7 TaxID=1880851 RepID=UPI000C84CEE4|nr:TatD family hydrolase [Vibrio sp. 10N.261.55.A7]PMJ92555.1 deoxyribonuclease [Vibrio sp. 10N.261.55.A7]
MTALFDTHCHFDFRQFGGDFDSELSAAKQQGVERFLIPSVNEDNWLAVQQLSYQYPEIYHALGFHPWFLPSQPAKALPSLVQALEQRSSQCVAIGECGLDFMTDTPSDRQESYLSMQLELAQQYDLPVILHCRKAHHRLIPMLKRYPLLKGGVLHGFSGSAQQAMSYIELGFYIGVGGTITYPRANKTRVAVSQLPLEFLVIETDAPDMPMHGFQGQPNHPKMLPKVLSELALLKKESEQTIARSLWKNSHKLLSICE